MRNKEYKKRETRTQQYVKKRVEKLKQKLNSVHTVAVCINQISSRLYINHLTRNK